MKHCLLLALLILGTPSLIHAGPPKPPSFEELDANADGKLSKTEVEKDPFLGREFGKLDKNGDGFLAKNELPCPPPGGPGHGPGIGKGGRPEGPGGHRPPDFEELDANKDGFLFKEEVVCEPCVSRFFDKLDADKNGKLSKDEVPACPPQDGPKPPAQQ